MSIPGPAGDRPGLLHGLLDRLVHASLENRFLAVAAGILLLGGGGWVGATLPVDLLHDPGSRQLTERMDGAALEAAHVCGATSLIKPEGDHVHEEIQPVTGSGGRGECVW